MSGCIFTFHRLHRNERSRLVSILGHGNRRLYNQQTQIITEVDVKLNKWHIAMKKLYRKPSETEQIFLKIMTHSVGLNHLKLSRRELSQSS